MESMRDYCRSRRILRGILVCCVLWLWACGNSGNDTSSVAPALVVKEVANPSSLKEYGLHLDRGAKTLLVQGDTLFGHLLRINAEICIGDVCGELSAEDYNHDDDDEDDVIRRFTSPVRRPFTAVFAGDTLQVHTTRLPVLEISTVEPIVDEPRVAGTFTLNDGEGKLVTSSVGIEYRGATSQSYLKKSYRLELTKDSTLSDGNNVALLGMRKDDDWNLQAIAMEPIRTQTKVVEDVWRKMSGEGVQSRYVELFVNGEYEGVYLLSERLDAKSLGLDESGSIYKAMDRLACTNFESYWEYDNSSLFWCGYEQIYPESIDWSAIYVWFDTFFKSTDSDYWDYHRSRFQVDNTIDAYLLINAFGLVDNVGKNSLLVYDGKTRLHRVALFDFNYSMGYDFMGSFSSEYHYSIADSLLTRLLENPESSEFRERYQRRWRELRQGVLATDSVLAMLDRNYGLLANSRVLGREASRWPDYKPANRAQLQNVKDWMAGHLLFLDGLYGL